MIKRMILMLIVVAAVVGVIGYFKYQGFQGFMAMKAGMASAKQTISTTKATLEDWKQQVEAVGSLRAAKGVDISNELVGTVEEIDFNSGDDVKEGTLLIKLRAEDDIAKLETLQAAEKLAEINYNRDKKQLAVQAVSQATVDTDAATLQGARAQVAEQKAVVDKKFIRAPFSGHMGIRNVDVGQYLSAGTAIVTLQQLDPIYLDFTLPQQSLAQIKVGQKLGVKSDTWPDTTFEGTIIAINPKVDLTTRNVQIRAELPNPDHKLLPGMYATAEITVGEEQKFVTLPQTAITYNPYGNTVFIVKSKGDKSKDDKGQDELVVDQVFVTIGETRGDQVQILKGVKDGDTVVSAGQLKLQNGSGVIVNNSVTPKDDANPTPQEQ
jgi:membrane fusion protein (multidrug efflux system)